MPSDRSTDRPLYGFTGPVAPQGRVILDRDFNALQLTASTPSVRISPAWWPKLRSGGLIAGHDYTHFPEVAAAMNAFVAKSGLHHRFRSSRSSWIVDKP